MRTPRAAFAAVGAALAFALVGCGSPGSGDAAAAAPAPADGEVAQDAGEDDGPGTEAGPEAGSDVDPDAAPDAGPEPVPEPDADDARDPEAERAAMACVAGAWEARTADLQQLFDEAAGGIGMELTVDGTIVYEFLEHGFGLVVLPTAFEMRMATAVGDVVGTMTGRAEGVWTVDGEYIRAVGDAWQDHLEMRWTFEGEDLEVDTGDVSMSDGFTEVDRFECAGDVLILQSPQGPPLTLVRMTPTG